MLSIFNKKFLITLSCVTSDTVMRNIQHKAPHFIVKDTFRLLKVTGVMFLMQKTASVLYF